MIHNLSSDYNLRGYAFEYIARIMLRREQKNNFIFLTWRFDDFSELLKKYRIHASEEWTETIALLNSHWRCSDIVALDLEFNGEMRLLRKICVYDAKTKFHKVKRNYFEMCEKDYSFFKMFEVLHPKSTYIISMILFDRWRFSFNILHFSRQNIRIYNSQKNKRVGFQRVKKEKDIPQPSAKRVKS